MLYPFFVHARHGKKIAGTYHFFTYLFILIKTIQAICNPPLL